jgi:hypothetical protein
VDDLGIDPAKLGDNHSRHLTRVLDCQQIDARLYHVPAQVWDNKTNRPKASVILMWPPHEMMMEVKVRAGPDHPHPQMHPHA